MLAANESLIAVIIVISNTAIARLIEWVTRDGSAALPTQFNIELVYLRDTIQRSRVFSVLLSTNVPHYMRVCLHFPPRRRRRADLLVFADSRALFSLCFLNDFTWLHTHAFNPRDGYRSPVVYSPSLREKESYCRVTIQKGKKKKKKKIEKKKRKGKKDGTYTDNRIVLATFLSMSKMFKC